MKPAVSSILDEEMLDDELEDDVMAMFEFDLELAIVKSNTHNGERYFYIFGQEGSIQIDSPDRPEVRLALSKPHGRYAAGVHDVSVGLSRRYLPDMDDLAVAIRERRHVRYFTPRHDLAVQRTLLRACGVEVQET